MPGLIRAITRGIWKWSPPDTDPEKCFPDDQLWYDTLQHDDSVSSMDYGQLLSFAKDSYTSVVSTIDALDRKAEVSFTLAGALAGIVFTGSKNFEVAPGWALYAAISCYLASMVFATISRIPAAIRLPMEIRGAHALLVNEAFRHVPFVLNLAGAYHCAAISTRLVSEWKSDKLTVAGVLICIGTGFILPALTTG